MTNPLAGPLLDDVLDARERIEAALAEMVDARRLVWKAAIDCGLPRQAQQFADRALPPEALVEAVASRTDPASDRLREAYRDLLAAEAAASSANDRLANALGRLRAALPPSERRAELRERLIGHPGMQLHRLHVLEDPRGRVRLAPRAVCGRRRTAMWRFAEPHPIEIRLCEACRESREAFPGEPDAVPTGLPTPSHPRRVLREAEALLMRAAWRSLPVAALAGVVLVAGALLDVGPIANNPVGEFVVGHVGRVIGAR